MFRNFSFAIIAAAVAATSLAAQAPAPSAAPSTTPSNSSASASNGSARAAADRVTVTGCIERADQMANTTAASSPGDPDSLQYVLVRPIAEQSSSAATPAPTGTTGESRVMYRLSGDQQKLNPHVGHKVEIVGMPTPMSAGNGATNAAAGASAPMPAGPAPGLTVENVRMLDATCATK
jgi:hypothetical protein